MRRRTTLMLAFLTVFATRAWADDLGAGQVVYQRYCATCHGVRGDGRGPSARYLDPRPRDFTRGNFKFRTTASGQVPTDGDLLRTVTYGVAGTSMPAWGKRQLTRRQLNAVVAYIKTFSPLFSDIDRCQSRDDCDDSYGCRKGRCVLIFTPPPPATDAAVERGKGLFDTLKCWQCHGRDGRGHGPSSSTLKDSEGYRIKAYDFTSGRYKGGTKPMDVFRTFMTGLDGTPMPSYGDAIQGPSRWDLVHFVRSLSRRRNLADYLFRDRAGSTNR